MAVYGSAFNVMFASTKTPEITVGMGATMLLWTDRHAATVVAVRRFKTGARKGLVKEVDVQRDNAVRVDTNGMSDSQDYRYEPDPQAPVRTYRADAKGRFRELVPAGTNIVLNPDGMYVHVPYGPYRMGTAGLLVGDRREYHDFSF